MFLEAIAYVTLRYVNLCLLVRQGRKAGFDTNVSNFGN